MPSPDKPAKGKEPLKLMPLEQFGKLVEKIAHVPKQALDEMESARTKRPREAKRP